MEWRGDSVECPLYFVVAVRHELHQFEFVEWTTKFLECLDQTILRQIVSVLADLTVQPARPSLDQFHVTSTFAAAEWIGESREGRGRVQGVLPNERFATGCQG